MSSSPLFQALRLPNGTILPNRLAKAAMEEDLADRNHAPGQRLCRLYRSWAAGGAGLIVTGNVMIDRRAMTGAGGVVLEDDSRLAQFAAWAEAARSGGAQAWVQLNHPGRQMYASLGQEAKGPSAVAVAIPGFSRMFSQPRAMSEAEILDVIERFRTAALLAQRAGFSGVEIHAAHGYLLSQFLSPLTNRRHDRWGGSLRNRARLLVETVRSVRAAVDPGFCVAVKLNSADFQRGGFGAGEAAEAVRMLDGLSVDLVELSGGSYEAPAMQGQTRDGSTLAREAYFLSFARDIARHASMPLMLTGGIRRRQVAEQVVTGGIAVAGMATALALRPQLPNDWRNGRHALPDLPAINWKNKTLAAAARTSVIKAQLDRISNGRMPDPGLSPLWQFLTGQLHNALLARRYRRWMEGSAG